MSSVVEVLQADDVDFLVPTQVCGIIKGPNLLCFSNLKAMDLKNKQNTFTPQMRTDITSLIVDYCLSHSTCRMRVKSNICIHVG